MPPRIPLPSAVRKTTALPTRRAFLTLPSILPSGGPVGPQTITASRRLPYPSRALFALIADIDAYASFLPYLTSSRVTAWSAPADSASPSPAPRRWPTRGVLSLGWGPLAATYTSRVYCTPHSVVEAVSGRVTPWEAARGTAAAGDRESVEGPFETLLTRWEVRPAARKLGSSGAGAEGRLEATDVTLKIVYQFAEAKQQLAARLVTHQVSEMMIAAFEKRAGEVLGKEKSGQDKVA